MNRLRVVFVGLVVVALSLGLVTGVNFGDRLGHLDTASDVEPRIAISVLEADVADDRFVATVRVRNPTDSAVVLESAALRVHNDSVRRIAAGPGDRLDDGPSTVPAGGAVEATFALALSDTNRRQVEAALVRDARLSMNAGMRYRSQEFEVVARGLRVDGGED